MKSDTTEILRVLCIDDKIYYFSKNISFSDGFYNNSTSYNKWHISELGCSVLLNETIKMCDCKYLNDYISESKIGCHQYVRLLMPALHNNKVEIVFKNKLFLSTYRIENIIAYLEEFTSKQIDFASKNDVINTLPIIKQYGLYDIDTLLNMEAIMKKRSWHWSIYENLKDKFKRLNLDCNDLGKRLIDFLKKVDYFNANVYGDYINLLARQPNVTIGDFFDKNYIDRHDIMSLEESTRVTEQDREKYIKIAEELSWIDRKENGYHIIVPKNISDLKYEGEIQHNCVYTNRYYIDVIDHHSIIVFLRKEEDVPFVTIEFDYETFEVLQALGKYNKKIDTELYRYIVNLGKQLYYEMHNHQ